MTTRLFLVRHGESTWNAVRRWQGQSDPPLSATGERQAVAAAAGLARLGSIDAVYTSTLRRARRTGELLASGTATVLADAVPALVERSAGPWEGLTRVEIDDRFPGYLDSGKRPEGYELDDSIVDRADAALTDLVARHPGSQLVVVSHGGVINALERQARRGPEEEWRRLDNLEGRWFESNGAQLGVVGARIHLLDEANVADPDDHADL